MGITFKIPSLEATLSEALEWATSDRPVSADAYKLAVELDRSPSRSVIPVLGAALLAKATDPRVDALALKHRNSPSAYSIRTVAQRALVPASKDPKRPFDLAVRGPEPINNQPWFRYEHMDDMKAVRDNARPFIDQLRKYLTRLNRMDPIDAGPAALSALAAFLRHRIEVHDAWEPVNLSDYGLALDEALAAFREFLSHPDDGPKRAQALVAATYDVAFGADRVSSGRVNDPSRKGVGDVRVFDGSQVAISVEVRNKPVQLHDALIFVRRCHDERIPKCHLMMFAQQESFDREALADEAARIGVLVNVVDSADQLLRLTLGYALRELAVMLSDLPHRVAMRLAEVDAHSATMEHWRTICSTDRGTNEETFR